MNVGVDFVARLSLCFIWIFTGITSVFFAKDVSYEVLAAACIDGALASFSIFSGSVLDLAIGFWLLIGRYLKACYLVQMAVITLYTLLLSAIEPSFWIHPFGPLTKNIPLLVMIYWLHRKECLDSAR